MIRKKQHALDSQTNCFVFPPHLPPPSDLRVPGESRGGTGACQKGAECGRIQPLQAHLPQHTPDQVRAPAPGHGHHPAGPHQQG